MVDLKETRGRGSSGAAPGVANVQSPAAVESGGRPLSAEEIAKVRLMGSMQRKLALLVGFINAGASLAVMFSAGGVVEVVYGEVIILSLLGLVLGTSSRSVRSLAAEVIKGGTVLEATAVAQRPQEGTLATFIMGGLPLSPSGFGSARKLKGLLGLENTPVKITYAKPAGESASPERLLILGANGAQIPTPFLCSWGGR